MDIRASTTMKDEATACTVRVLLFSSLREHAGRSEVEITLPPKSTGAELLDAFFSCYPEVEAMRSTVRIAVNAEYVTTDAPISEGDEVALITPVSGG